MHLLHCISLLISLHLFVSTYTVYLQKSLKSCFHVAETMSHVFIMSNDSPVKGRLSGTTHLLSALDVAVDQKKSIFKDLFVSLCTWVG